MFSEGEHVPELLRADKEQLDRAAALLGGDERAFVIAVCPKDLVPAAREHMAKQAGVEVPEPVVLQGSGEALEALLGTLPGIAGAKVRSLVVGGDVKETLRALNWHREKVLRGAPVVLWLDGVDGLIEVREVAPDAYAFRDVVVMVRGDGGRLPQVPYKETPRILEARRVVARAKGGVERAEAFRRLSGELRVHGHLVEAENVARRGLEVLSTERFSGDRARIARAWLWAQAAMAAHERGAQARQRRCAEQGSDNLKGVTIPNAQDVRAWLFAATPGPYAERDRAYAEEALLLAQREPRNTYTYTQAIRSSTSLARGLGDLRKARHLLAQLSSAPLDAINKSLLVLDLAKNAAETGRMHECETHLQVSMLLRQKEHLRSPALGCAFVRCWLDRGELDVAEKIIGDSFVNLDPTECWYRNILVAHLSLVRGNIDAALVSARIALRSAAQFSLDGAHIDASGLLTWITTAAHDAKRHDVEPLKKISAEQEVEEDVSRAICSNDPPPWYPIRFLRFRSDLLIHTDSQNEAHDLARRAHDLARRTCEDLIPETGRALADNLLRAGKPDEALPILASVEPEAASRGMLKELSYIRALRVLALVLRNEPPPAIEPAMTSLREALESTGSPRIKAETLQDLAIRLPPATTLPDPLALASETHALFVEMPMPAKEARSLELAGDVLAARGKPADAKRRYLTARGILERRGLGLRLPLLVSKIDRLSGS